MLEVEKISVNFEVADFLRSIIDSEHRTLFSKRESGTPLLTPKGLPISKLLQKVQPRGPL